jgi:hypothetical protein
VATNVPSAGGEWVRRHRRSGIRWGSIAAWRAVREVAKGEKEMNNNWVVLSNDGEITVLRRETQDAIREAELHRPDGTDASAWRTLWSLGGSYSADEYVSKVQNVFSIPPHAVVKDAKWLTECAPKGMQKVLSKLFSRKSVYDVIQEIVAPTYAEPTKKFCGSVDAMPVGSKWRFWMLHIESKCGVMRLRRSSVSLLQ